MDLDYNMKEEYFIQERCHNCNNKVVMEWNTAKHGFIAYCPFCGARLFLCSVCPHSQNGDRTCDWKCDFNGNEECMCSLTI